jgi:surface protein
MFQDAASMNSDFNHWDTSNITVMSELFSRATAFNGAIDQWDVSSVTDMRSMFNVASAFNQPIGDWVVSSVTNMFGMFFQADSFNAAIGGWDVSLVENMNSMFFEAGSFNADISGWDVSSVTDIRWMLANASIFNQAIGGWVIGNVTEMDNMLNNSGLSRENYDATLTGWATQAVQAGVELGAEGLEYCAEAERQILTDAPNNWTITGDALAADCSGPVVVEDLRILASNRSDFVFSDSGLDPAFSFKIEILPDKGQLLLDGVPVSVDEIISVLDIDSGKLIWSHSTDEHGYRYSEFAARIIDDVGVESDAFEIKIDLGAAFVDLSHDGEGWRFMTSPAIGETFASLLEPIYTQGIPGSNNPGAAFPNVYRIDQANYQWEVPGHMDEEIGIGEAYIVYVYSDDNGNGTPDGFPKRLLSGETWLNLSDGFEFTGLDYDPDPAGVNPDNFYLIGNPHPVSLDFCQMLIFLASEMSPSAHFWDPSANGGNGDYIAGTCVLPPAIHIAPFQAFWVQTFAVNPELSTGFFLETMEDGFFKEQSTSLQPGIANLDSGLENPFGEVLHASFEVAGEDGVFTNRAHLLFSDEGTFGMDRFDVPKLDASGLAQRWISLHTLDDNGKPYAFRSLPSDFGDQITIPMDIRTTEAGMYELTWELPPTLVFKRSYWLRDNHIGRVMELIEGGTYRFEVDVPSSVHSGWTDDSLPVPLHSSVHGKWTDESARFELLIADSGVDGRAELGNLPDRVSLAQNYPNPFNPSTIINFELPQQSQVRLDVFDMVGRQVATLIDGSQMQAGRHQVNFNASNLPSGIYMYRLQAGSSMLTRKLTLIK